MRDVSFPLFLITLFFFILQSCSEHAKAIHTSPEFSTDFKKIEVPSTISNDGSYTDGSFTTAFQDLAGFVWLGSEMGIYVFDGNAFTRIQVDEAYPTLIVSSIDQDMNGIIWIGTDRGIYWLSGNRFYPFQIPTSEGNLQFVNHLVKDTVITDLHFDNEGNLWYGIYDGGLWRYNGKSFTQFQPVAGEWHITHQHELRHPTTKGYIQDIFEDKGGRVWISFRGDGPALSYFSNNRFQVVNTDEISDKTLISILQDKEGTVWVLSPGDGPFFINDESQLQPFPISDSNALSFGLVAGLNNDLWMATAMESQNANDEKTIYRLDRQSKKWSATDIGGEENLFPLLADRKGNLWLTGDGFSLYVYNGKETINCISRD